ncbi:MAG: amidohydrolase [Halobacteriovoraceae bacterium]|nr:amidohydrolase [Halobacteriovoraceae bacterium]
MKNKLAHLFLLATIGLILSACQSMVSPLGGNFNDNIEEAKKELSPETKRFIEKAFSEFEPDDCIVDFHLHAIGMGVHKDDTWVNPTLSSIWDPHTFIKYNVFKSAGGIKDHETADDDYIERLVRLQRSEPRIGRLLLFAFDYYHNDEGKRVPESSTFYVSNDYVLEIAKRFPDVFVPVGSIHPYRKDALSSLERLAKRGVRFIKWLPNSQNIDPSSARAKAFFEVMKKYEMTLISHTGHEKAVHGEEHQALGNPLLLKTALNLQVKVIMAHLASLGTCSDLENGGKTESCFDLFWRIIEDEKYRGLAFGEMSGTTIHTRIGHPYNKVLEHPELKYRFVNGSDYPLPAINMLYRTKQYLEMGYITEKEREALNEIYHYNPLLFDFMSKRVLKHPQLKTTLSKEIFTSQSLLECKNES